ncbi:MAG TPA: MlaD family protein [Thermoanaerobaculia bacterium]|nr:MlaD family protein [Thermoanaerobaculia bacterium]
MKSEGSALRVGFMVVATAAVLALGIFLIGQQNFLFTATNSYFVRYGNVGGLAEGNPVQLSGVNVGRVERIVLPEETTEPGIEVWIEIERRYAERIRQDSVARIKSLGLLGDKYVQITSGSPQAPAVEPGDEIAADQPTDVDALIASGEDVMGDIVSTARSLSTILERMEAGEGLLGELVSAREGKRVTDTAIETLESVQRVAADVEAGRGMLGRLVADEQLADRIGDVVEQLDSVLGEIRTGDGLLPALISDSETRTAFEQTVEGARSTLDDLSGVAADISEGDGLLPRLIHDEEVARQLLDETNELLERLNRVTEKLDQGEGTAAQLINDPSVYEALEDVVVGVNESRFLRWLIRNRQKAGIEKRYREAIEDADQVEEPPPPEPPKG